MVKVLRTAGRNRHRRPNGSLLPLYKTLHNPDLVKALAHPLRAKMLYELQEREASPKDLSKQFGVPLANVAYHIQVLRKLKLIRLVKKTPRRGAIEHRYKADQAAHIDDKAWSETPDLIKQRMVAANIEEVGRYVTAAAATGGFERDNSHLTRSRLVLDGEAWDTLAEKLMEVWTMVPALQEQSEARLRKSNHADERRAGLVMMLFETTPAVPNADEAALSPASSAGEPVETREPAGLVD
jgi:DNA-binding transcriptional ArsR family regulator